MTAKTIINIKCRCLEYFVTQVYPIASLQIYLNFLNWVGLFGVPFMHEEVISSIDLVLVRINNHDIVRNNEFDCIVLLQIPQDLLSIQNLLYIMLHQQKLAGKQMNTMVTVSFLDSSSISAGK